MSIAGDTMEEHYQDYVLPRYKALIEAQKEYISFLGGEIGRLSIPVRHSSMPTEEVVIQGANFRNRLKYLEDNLNDSK